MWQWDNELYERGFRRRSERYWQCVRGHGLPVDAHLSLFSWAEQTLPGRHKGQHRYLVEVTEFHVTFLIGIDHLHFYYHERWHNDWKPAGHTSGGELLRLGLVPAQWRQRADEVAARLVASLAGTLYPRYQR
jgi:hypothetical protein